MAAVVLNITDVDAAETMDVILSGSFSFCAAAAAMAADSANQTKYLLQIFSVSRI